MTIQAVQRFGRSVCGEFRRHRSESIAPYLRDGLGMTNPARRRKHEFIPFRQANNDVNCCTAQRTNALASLAIPEAQQLGCEIYLLPLQALSFTEAQPGKSDEPNAGSD